ncbi:MAG: flagellar hook-associated protein FlgL [Ignavibacteria bacterium]|nr:flagellar hook-associated protein FlgL [Ignavibacteria bacterium]
MRVTQRSLQLSYLINMQKTQEKVGFYQKQITTQSKINKPSDSPIGSARVMRLSNQVESLSVYSKNIDSGLPLIGRTISAMETMQSEIEKLRSDFTLMNNPLENENLDIYAQNVDRAIAALLDSANSEFDGQYLFGGTDFSQKPFGYNSTNTAVEVKASDISGIHKIKISDTISQKINIQGNELFSAITQQNGNLDSGSAVGSVQLGSTTVLDADGNEYTLNFNYTKTAANDYTFDYSVVDSSSVTITNGSNQISFDPATGKLSTIDGANPSLIGITVPANKLDLRIDLSNMTEAASATNLTYLQNQKADIFNTLISIKEQLNNGIKPNSNQIAVVENFHSHLLNKMSEAGSIQNRLENTQLMLQNSDIQTRELLSKEKDVDMAAALVSLQNEQYNLELSYKISSMILPKSLLDYL